MDKQVKWLDGNRIQIDPPKRTKKVTGTRFATILGLNPWSTPFEMWCAITKTYEKPFEDTIYTIAGKTIEPKQAEYIQRCYGIDLISPSDQYGDDYFRKTYGDFFKESKHLGGMWDFLGTDEKGNVDTVYEMKTTKRIEDWQDDVPEYYALQAALYAHLLGVDNVVMVASFLEDKDYQHPEKFVPSVHNTITVSFKVSERYPHFAILVQKVEEWWDDYVSSGISPTFDPKKDGDIVKALRTTTVSVDTELSSLIAEAESLKAEIDAVTVSIADKKKRYDAIKDAILAQAQSAMSPSDNTAVFNGSKFNFTVDRTCRTTIDKSALEADGLLDKYQTTSESFRVAVKEK